MGESTFADRKATVSELLAQDRQKLLMQLPFTGSLVIRLDLVPEISWKELLAQFVSSCTGGSRPVFRYIDGHPELDPNLLIYFTDGCGDYPDRAPAYPVM